MTKNINLDELVDVCGGKMDLKRLSEEISYYMVKSPDKLVVIIERKNKFSSNDIPYDPMKGYHTNLYITKKDFYNKC